MNDMNDMKVNVEESTVKRFDKSDSTRRPLFKFFFEKGNKKIIVYACVFYDYLLFNVKLNESRNDDFWRQKLSTSIRDFNREQILNQIYLEPGETMTLIPKLNIQEFQFIYNFVSGYVIEKMIHESIKIVKEIKNPISAWKIEGRRIE